MTTETLFEHRSIQVTGKVAVIGSITYNLIRFVQHMEIINGIFLILTSILGLVYLAYKVVHTHIDLIEKNEKRIQEGLPPIKFNWKFWKSWGSKK